MSLGARGFPIDEVQREPDVLRAVKRVIDRRRTPGRFLITGAANLLLVRHVCYWRTASEEVDLVIDTGGRLVPIEVKAAGRPCLADAAPLRIAAGCRDRQPSSRRCVGERGEAVRLMRARTCAGTDVQPPERVRARQLSLTGPRW